jgi:FtsH-binding integral membrane protein
MNKQYGSFMKSFFNQTHRGASSISASAYNAIIGLTLLWGFFINYMLVTSIPTSDLASINPWVFYIGYFASCFAGIYLFSSSDNPVVSFIGYNLIVVPFGLVLNVVISRYSDTVVVDAVRVTGLVTAGMMVLGTLFPAFFKKISRALFISLIVVIIVELVEIFVFGIHHSFLDWVVAIIFCGYIGYDWSRAQALPKTVDNAIDSAAALYVDIINLFIRIMSILGNKD